MRYQEGELYGALFEVAEQISDPKSGSEAETFCKQLKNLNFIVSNAIWHDILFQFKGKDLQHIFVGLLEQLQLIA